ncbi:hypothetical protein QQF64_007212 [Cirrhinus molitorella]|uniref:Uncharacterized protein n=1 Tax=Cirrhinus molitorella TaxID=172907 RepID=A0ABR3MA24_9TELE
MLLQITESDREKDSKRERETEHTFSQRFLVSEAAWRGGVLQKLGAASEAEWRGGEDLAICVSRDLQEEEDHIVTLLLERRCDKRLKQTENQTAAHCFPLKPLDLGRMPRQRPANETQPGIPSSPASELDMMLLPRPPGCANLANG